MNIQVFTFSGFQENTTVLYNDAKEAVIIDPGCLEKHEQDELSQFIATNELKVLALLNTHCHLDHIFGNHFVMKTYNVGCWIHKEELFTLSLAEQSANLYGIRGFVLPPEPTDFFEDHQVLQFGEIRMTVIFGPGHSVGHCAFYLPEYNLLIGGDILFKGSFGRTDLPGGDMQTLKTTIHTRMFTLPDDTVVIPGHGPTTTIGEEKKSNYILQF